MPKKSDFEKTGISSWRNKKNRRKIGFAFSTLAEWWKWKMLHWLTIRLGTMWHCGAVLCTKNYSPPSGNKEYYITAIQCKTLCSRILCWFACFAASHVCWRSVFRPSIEYRINFEVECYHSYDNGYILITRSLLSPHCHNHSLPDHIFLAVYALQESRD